MGLSVAAVVEESRAPPEPWMRAVDNDEKRQMPRVKAPRVLLRVADTAKFRENYVQDLSQGGIFVRTEKPLAVGTTLELDLLPPGWDKPLALRGRVVRVVNDLAAIERKAAGMGLTFEGVEAEVEAKLLALVAEYRVEPRMPTPLPPRPAEVPGELERLRVMLLDREQALQLARAAEQQGIAQQLELRRERDELAQKSRQLSEELDRRVAQGAAAAGAAPDEALASAQARREAIELRLRLTEAEGKLEAQQAELRAFEQDDAQSRELAEQLALQKNKLEKQRRKESEEAAAERARLTAERDALAQRLEAQEQGGRQRSDELTQQLAQAQAARGEGETLLAAAAQRALELDLRVAELQRALTDAHAIAERAQAAQTQATALQAALDEERLRAEGLERRLADVTARHEKVAAKERELRRLVALLSSGKGEDELVMIEPSAEEAPAAAAPTDELDVDVDVTSTPGPKPGRAVVSQPQPPPDAEDVEAFHNLLAAGVRLRRTQKFNLFMPIEPQEGRVAAWLEQGSTLEELKQLSAGRMTEEKLVRAVHDFFTRGFLELGEG